MGLRSAQGCRLNGKLGAIGVPNNKENFDRLECETTYVIAHSDQNPPHPAIPTVEHTRGPEESGSVVCSENSTVILLYTSRITQDSSCRLVIDKFNKWVINLDTSPMVLCHHIFSTLLSRSFQFVEPERSITIKTYDHLFLFSPMEAFCVLLCSCAFWSLHPPLDVSVPVPDLNCAILISVK